MSSFITVKEFAALANVTTQAVYKRISQQDNTIQQYIKIDGKYKLISTDALKLFAEENTDPAPEQNKTAEQTQNQKAPEPAAPENNTQKNNSMLPSPDEYRLLNQTTDKLVSSLENHITDLKKEIETLRNELAEKNLQLSNLNERLANEQELHRHNQLLLVSSQEQQEQQEEPEKNSGFFKKLFKK